MLSGAGILSTAVELRMSSRFIIVSRTARRRATMPNGFREASMGSSTITSTTLDLDTLGGRLIEAGKDARQRIQLAQSG